MPSLRPGGRHAAPLGPPDRRCSAAPKAVLSPASDCVVLTLKAPASIADKPTKRCPPKPDADPARLRPRGSYPAFPWGAAAGCGCSCPKRTSGSALWTGIPGSLFSSEVPSLHQAPYSRNSHCLHLASCIPWPVSSSEPASRLHIVSNETHPKPMQDSCQFSTRPPCPSSRPRSLTMRNPP
jgi:hypothetical protein